LVLSVDFWDIELLLDYQINREIATVCLAKFDGFSLTEGG
jgi:hypothetical protein